MTEHQARDELLRVLDKLGIRRGDTIYLGINIGNLPLPSYSADLTRESIQARKLRWCGFVLDVLRSVLGEAGTLLAPAFTPSFAGARTPYIHEESPAEIGPFPEFLRQQPGALRSFHPMFSVTGIGHNAAAILGNTGRTAFGPTSPFGRLSKFDTRFLFLGIRLRDALTYCHHLEQTYGANHRYHKVLTAPVLKDNAPVAGPWLSYMRFLGVGPQVDLAAFEARLLNEGALKETFSLGHASQCVSSRDVDETGYRMLMEDPCSFLSAPVAVELEENATVEHPLPGPVARFRLS